MQRQGLAGQPRLAILRDQPPGQAQFLDVPGVVRAFAERHGGVSACRGVGDLTGVEVGTVGDMHHGALASLGVPGRQMGHPVRPQTQLGAVAAPAQGGLGVGVMGIAQRRWVVDVERHIEGVLIVHDIGPGRGLGEEQLRVGADEEPRRGVPLLQIAVDRDRSRRRHGLLAAVGAESLGEGARGRAHGPRRGAHLLQGQQFAQTRMQRLLLTMVGDVGVLRGQRLDETHADAGGGGRLTEVEQRVGVGRSPPDRHRGARPLLPGRRRRGQRVEVAGAGVGVDGHGLGEGVDETDGRDGLRRVPAQRCPGRRGLGQGGPGAVPPLAAGVAADHAVVQPLSAEGLPFAVVVSRLAVGEWRRLPGQVDVTSTQQAQSGDLGTAWWCRRTRACESDPQGADRQKVRQGQHAHVSGRVRVRQRRPVRIVVEPARVGGLGTQDAEVPLGDRDERADRDGPDKGKADVLARRAILTRTPESVRRRGALEAEEGRQRLVRDAIGLRARAGRQLRTLRQVQVSHRQRRVEPSRWQGHRRPEGEADGKA